MSDRTIMDRVEYGDQIIAQAIDRNDPETELADLLGDLLHWAQARGVPFDEALRQARAHFDAEDRGIDVETMGQTAYRQAFGIKAAQRRKARHEAADQYEDPAAPRCGWCNALITDHTAGELATCKGYGGGQ